MRILFWGMEGPFSFEPLAALLGAGNEVCALFVPHSDSGIAAPEQIFPPDPVDAELPILTPYIERTAIHLAWEVGIPVFALGDLTAPEVRDLVSQWRADAACVACFPKRIPETLLGAIRHGFYNIHPSLLPAYRGPAPLFWTLRDGAAQTGVTVHLMDRRLDRGDIVAQAPLELPDGISGPQADTLLGRLGGELLAEALQALGQGVQRRVPQPPGGFYRGYPGDKDFQLDRSWSAHRAFNFMRGTLEWGRPYSLTIGGEQLILSQAIRIDPRAELGVPYVRTGRQTEIQFNPGILVVQMGDI